MNGYNGYTNWETCDVYTIIANNESVYKDFMRCRNAGQIHDLWYETFESSDEESLNLSYGEDMNLDLVNWDEIYESLHEEDE